MARAHKTAEQHQLMVDPLQTLPDGVEDLNLLSFAFSRLMQSDDFANDHHQRFLGATLLRATLLGATLLHATLLRAPLFSMILLSVTLLRTILTGVTVIGMAVLRAMLNGVTLLGRTLLGPTLFVRTLVGRTLLGTISRAKAATVVAIAAFTDPRRSVRK
jgi:uncharacterized protein YjbI with pentapeptide repeats